MSQKYTTLTLIRHGEVAERYHHVFGGRRIDMELSARGHEQAKTLAKHLDGIHFGAIYASPMQRAQQTLAPIAAHQAAKPITLDGLAEVDFGDWTGLNWQQLHDKYQHTAYEWLDKLDAAQVPNGESGQSFRARVEPCLQQILTDCPGQNVAVVCHGGVVRMLLSLLLNLPLPRMGSFEVEYASMTVVELTPLRARVQLLNFTAWRDLRSA
jgi:broad specificity phosphatase PhoE